MQQHALVLVRMGFSVPVMMPRLRLRNGHNEAPVLHTFQPDQAAGKLLYQSGFSMDNQDFQA